jgi:Uma2 family endonuclease
MQHAPPESALRLLAPWSAFPLRVRPAQPMNDDALYALCVANRDLRIERTADGELVMMPPTGAETSRRNAALTSAVVVWPSDTLADVHAKMREYASCGARLGWAIDPPSRRMWVYEGRAEPVCLEQPDTVSGGDVLPGSRST